MWMWVFVKCVKYEECMNVCVFEKFIFIIKYSKDELDFFEMEYLFVLREIMMWNFIFYGSGCNYRFIILIILFVYWILYGK